MCAPPWRPEKEGPPVKKKFRMRTGNAGAELVLFCILLFTAGKAVASEEQKKEGTEELRDRTPAWQIEELIVKGKKEPKLKEEQRVGPYGQPRWTMVHQNVTAVYVFPVRRSDEGRAQRSRWVLIVHRIRR